MPRWWVSFKDLFKLLPFELMGVARATPKPVVSRHRVVLGIGVPTD